MNESATTDNPQKTRHGKVFFADDAARALLSGRLDTLCSPDAQQWQKVKYNASRTVYRGEIDGQEIYLKHYHPRSLIQRLRRRLGSFDALREMRFSQYLSSRGVSTPSVLAAMCGDGMEWLATRGIRPCEPADIWYTRQLAAGGSGQRPIRQAMLELAKLVGKMHAAGVIHGDLHCGNILVRTNADPVRLVLTDLHRMRKRRRLSRRAKAANLAKLLHDRFDFTTRTQRLRFLKRYLQVSGVSSRLRGWQLMVEDFARRHRTRQYAHRDRRIFGLNKYFSPMKLPRGWRGHVVLASKRHLAGSQAAECTFTPDAWREVLRQPEKLFEGDDAEVVKDSRSSLVVRRRLNIGEHTVTVYLKRRRRKYAWKILADCFRPSRSIRAFWRGHALLTRQIATAMPLAALERRTGRFLRDSILITEAVEGQKLNTFLNTWLSYPPQDEKLLSVTQQRQLAQEVLWQLGRTVQRLHDNNFAHRDLKATNLLVRWSRGQSPEIVLVDLDGLKHMMWITSRRQFQGLMRLNVSLLKCPVVNHAGRLRMLLGYLRRPGSGRIHFKPYWRVLESWSARKLGQQIRSRRKRQKATRRT